MSPCRGDAYWHGQQIAKVGRRVCLQFARIVSGRAPYCRTELRPFGHVMTIDAFAVPQPLAEEGMELLEKAAGQGHVYAMHTLAHIYDVRKEHEHAMQWWTKAGAYTRSLLSST